MFLRKSNNLWKEAYKATAKFYAGNNNVFGVFSLMENTDTIFVCTPVAQIDNREVEMWRILLMPLEGEPIGDVDFYKALEYFKTINSEIRGNEILVKGLSKQQLMKIKQCCS